MKARQDTSPARPEAPSQAASTSPRPRHSTCAHCSHPAAGEQGWVQSRRQTEQQPRLGGQDPAVPRLLGALLAPARALLRAARSRDDINQEF